MSFQNYQTPNQFMPNQNRYMMQNNIVWVQGIEGAKAVQLPSNSNIMLLDSENEGIFYIKTTDNIGMYNLRLFKYEEVTNSPKQVVTPDIDLSNYVTKDELQEILKEVKTNGKSTIQSAQSNAKPIITK